MERPTDRYRVRVYYIPEHRMLAMFNAQIIARRSDVFAPEFLLIDGVPEDAEVLRVCYAWERRAFGMLVAHPSFDEVMPEEKPPEFPGDFISYRVIIPRAEIAQALKMRALPTIETAGQIPPATLTVTDRKAWEFLGPPR